MAENTTFDLDGEEIVTNAIIDLVNDYPLLGGDVIRYSVLDAEKGKAIFPMSGSAVTTNIKDITGHVYQVCEYPFIVVYRSGSLSEARKKAIKEWLDNLGRWLEKQHIKGNNGTEYKLEEYPALTNGRKFKRIERSTGSYQDSIGENQIEQWAINIVATYENEYDE